jgi:hypothetical protein
VPYSRSDLLTSVNAFPPQTGSLCYLLHASRFGHVAERGNENAWVGLFCGSREIFGNNFVVIEVFRDVKWRVSRFHDCSFLSSRANFYFSKYFTFSIPLKSAS